MCKLEKTDQDGFDEFHNVSVGFDWSVRVSTHRRDLDHQEAAVPYIRSTGDEEGVWGGGKTLVGQCGFHGVTVWTLSSSLGGTFQSVIVKNAM